MKVVLLIAFFLIATTCCSALKDTDLILDDERIASLNEEGNTWVAGRNPRFEGMTVAEVKRMMGTKISPDQPIMRIQQYFGDDATDIPASFDSRTQWPGCIHPILDQGKCGSCWAFAATESLSDRLCIASNKSIDVVLSPQSLVSCDFYGNMGCNGGIPQLAWEYMELAGVATLKCFPYTSGANGTSNKCISKCQDGSLVVKYKAKPFTQHTWRSVSEIQNAIIAHGPVEGAFIVYDDFINYQSGVYHKSANAKELGGHAVKIIGWGHDDASDKDYWIIANSWGTSWGIDGFFWIQRGNDECGIEGDVCAAEAHL